MGISKDTSNDWQILKSRVLPLVKPLWRRLLIAMVCMMLVGALTAAAAYLVKPVLDEIFFKKDMTMLKILPFAIMLLYLLKGLAYFGQAYLMNFVGHKIIKQLRDELYSHIQRLSLSFFDCHETGVLMARIMNDVNIVKAMVTKGVTGLIQHSFSIIGLVCHFLQGLEAGLNRSGRLSFGNDPDCEIWEAYAPIECQVSRKHGGHKLLSA